MTLLRRLAASALVCTACAAAHAQRVEDAAELTRIFSGQSANIQHRNGALQKVFFDPSGSARTTARDGSVRDAKWEVKGSTVCHDLSNPRKCYRVIRVGEGRYDLESEDFQWRPTYTMVPGRMEGL